MITIANLEEDLGVGGEPFFFSQVNESDEGEDSEILYFSVCCLSVAVDLKQMKADIERHWSEGPEINSDFNGYYFREVSTCIKVIEAEEIHLDHAGFHGFDSESFLVLHALYAAHSAQWYGGNSGDHCQASTEQDEKWLRFFLHYFELISNGDCACASDALSAVTSTKEYATDCEIAL